ncbi:MAG: ribose 5-phosphate isomerase B [Gemmatimonadaceae bacterium]|nr:ribose 5-phosphate isomerase B [Gemmatimonadaceae bacterium]
MDAQRRRRDRSSRLRPRRVRSLLPWDVRHLRRRVPAAPAERAGDRACRRAGGDDAEPRGRRAERRHRGHLRRRRADAGRTRGAELPAPRPVGGGEGGARPGAACGARSDRAARDLCARLAAGEGRRVSKPLVTEREVRRAAREGKKSLDVSGAVVTPGARDVAGALGVELSRGAGAARRGAPPEKQSTPTPAPPRNQSAAPSPETAPRPTVAVGADHGGLAMKNAIAEHLRAAGYSVSDLGTNSSDAVDYPDFAVAVARAVASTQAAFGIMVDGAGIGSCMAANKVAGVRAAMCHDVTTAVNAREHNGANMLTLGGGLLGMRLALAIVDTFLATPFAGGRHAKRVEKIDALDRRG